jgi:hypothetical protein
MEGGKKNQKKHWYMLQPNREIWRFFKIVDIWRVENPKKHILLANLREKKTKKPNWLYLARKKRKRKKKKPHRK